MKTTKIQKTIRCRKGERVSLEPFSFARCNEFYHLYLASKAEWEKFLILHFKTIDNAHNFIAQQYNNDRFTGYFVINNSTDKMVGFILGDEIDSDAIMRTRATGEEYENLGYGYEATQLFETLMKEAGYSSIQLSCEEDNLRSKELLLRDGYQYNRSVRVSVPGVSLKFDFFSKQL